jgi:hypothetical protein
MEHNDFLDLFVSWHFCQNFFHDQPKPPPPHADMVTEPQMVIKEFIFLKKSSYYFLFFTL